MPTCGLPGVGPPRWTLLAHALLLAACSAMWGASEDPHLSATLLLSCLAVWNTSGSVEGRPPPPFSRTATTAMLSVEPASYAACRTASATACSLAEVLQGTMADGLVPVRYRVANDIC